MKLSFRKRFTLFPGFRLNFSKKRVSATIGPKAGNVNIGSNGVYINSSIPGTGLYSRQKITDSKKQNKQLEKNMYHQKETPTSGCLYLLSVIPMGVGLSLLITIGESSVHANIIGLVLAISGLPLFYYLYKKTGVEKGKEGWYTLLLSFMIGFFVFYFTFSNFHEIRKQTEIEKLPVKSQTEVVQKTERIILEPEIFIMGVDASLPYDEFVKQVKKKLKKMDDSRIEQRACYLNGYADFFGSYAFYEISKITEEKWVIRISIRTSSDTRFAMQELKRILSDTYGSSPRSRKHKYTTYYEFSEMRPIIQIYHGNRPDLCTEQGLFDVKIQYLFGFDHLKDIWSYDLYY